MTSLAKAVLPLIRTRADVWRWSAANAHGAQMHEAIDLLESALPTVDAIEAWAVAHKALASSLTVIARSDDSSGVIGDACRRLLELHPRLAAAAQVAPTKLVEWMSEECARTASVSTGSSHASACARFRSLDDTAQAQAEIDQIDLAIDWARHATDAGPPHQALQA